MFTCKWQLVHPPSETEGKLSSTDLYKLIKKWNRFPSRKWNKKLGRFESTNGDYRLWDLKPSIYDCKTYVTDKTEPLPSCTDIPRGFDFFEYDLNDDNLLIAACSEMNYLFDELKSCNSKINNDIVRVSRKNGRSFWPDFDSYMIQSQQFKDHFELNGCFLPLNTAFMTQWMQDHGFDNALKLFTHHYDRVIKSIYDSQNTKNDSMLDLKRHIDEHSTLQFLKYESGVGINAHIDNLLRSDSTVIAIGFGRDVVYDLSPVLHTEHKFKGKVIRATLPEGSAVVLNDDVRYHWTHAVPYGIQGVKFTMIWKLYHTKKMLSNHIEQEKFSSVLACAMYSLKLNKMP